MLETLGDRSGSFESQLVKKNQTKLMSEINEKISSIFALVMMSYLDIRDHIKDMYAVEVSNATITAITVLIYPLIWLNTINYEIKENGRYVSKSIYTVLDVNIEGPKKSLDLYVFESEG